jgi:hypothetical protein
MTDYQSNSKRSKEEAEVEKNVEKVVVGEVVVKKTPLGRKIKNLFVEADPKTAGKYVVANVFIPQLRNMVYDAISKGAARMMFGEAAASRRGQELGSRFTYPYHSNPLNPAIRNAMQQRNAPVPPQGPRSARYSRDEFILASREEAELVLERMNDIIDTYQIVSVSDLNELVGFPTSHVDQKWGWVNLAAAQIHQIREGYLLDLPPAEPLG